MLRGLQTGNQGLYCYFGCACQQFVVVAVASAAAAAAIAVEARSRGGRRGARNRAGGLLGVEEIAYTVGLGRKSRLGAQERERGVVGVSSGALDNGERGGGDKDEREAEERSRRRRRG
ncbi:hypothetical protein FCM35_KLT17338 [Carex littledalei]|uniref:Uncharacterized protein n=1 Tax=Carex littledalei TaxID=544730 RepID=A0A833VH51_9POAL|nr:hypothetical protein FCM35_KLT17338 [Carex littledalei]